MTADAPRLISIFVNPSYVNMSHAAPQRFLQTAFAEEIQNPSMRALLFIIAKNMEILGLYVSLMSVEYYWPLAKVYMLQALQSAEFIISHNPEHALAIFAIYLLQHEA